MTFKVVPENIESFGRLIGRSSEDVQEAISYLAKKTEVDDARSSTVWNFVGGSHEKVVREVRDGLKAFIEVLDASKKELYKSAKYYRVTDKDTAAKLDSTYPSAKMPDTLPAAIFGDIDPTDFMDRETPTDSLKASDDGNYFQEWGSEFMLNPFSKLGGAVMDFGSPVGLVSEALIFCGITDLFEKPVQYLAGDWEGFMESAHAWGCLANFCAALAENIEWGNRVLEETWHGKSATVAWAYFHELAQKFRAASDSLNSLEEHYQYLARAVYNAAELAKGAMVTICDLAVQAILFAIAAAAAAATVAGAPYAAGLEAMSMMRVVTALKNYSTILASLGSAATGVQALCTAMFIAATGMSEVKAFPKPGNEGYDHKAV